MSDASRDITSPAECAAWSDLETVVEQFEAARSRDDGVLWQLYLPPKEHPHFGEISCELIRVDMEYRFARGESCRLEQYRTVCPEVFQDPESLEQMAFEEYRLRCQAGETLDVQEYGRRFGISASDWPTPLADGTLGGSVRASDVCERSGLGARATGSVCDGSRFPCAGERFGGFELVEELGRGTFAWVFLARQGDLSNRNVVLKVSSRPSAEPERLARLQHSNIVPVYSVHRMGNLHAVCMPFLGSSTLADLDRTQSTDAILGIARQIADGLAHAHRRGIIHRDLKPANILLTDDGVPMILDFNLASDSESREPQPIGGTLPYMAPEHVAAVRAGGEIDARADVYSLGVILYELLAGRRPFPDYRQPFEECAPRMISDRRAGAAPLRAQRPGMSPGVASIVSRCLEAQPEQRYPSAHELQEDLRRQLENLPLRHAANPSLAERAVKWHRRHPRITSASSVSAAAFLVLAVVAVAWMFRSHQFKSLVAEQQLVAFQHDLPLARVPLTLPDADVSALNEGIGAAQRLLAPYGVLEMEDWRSRPSYALLSPPRRAMLDDRMTELLYLLASATLRQGEFANDEQASKSRCEEALRLNELAQALCGSGPPPRALAIQQAELLRLMGRVPEPASDLDGAEASRPGRAMESELAAIDDMLHGRFAEALPVLETIRSDAPYDVSVWLLTGNALAGLGRHQEAEGCYTTCIALRPSSHLGYHYRGLCRLELKKFAEAESDFQQVLAIRPRDTTALLNRALSRQGLEQWDSALNDLSAALDMGAADTRIYFLRANLHRRLGDFESARRDLAEGLRRPPNDEKSSLARGVALMEANPQRALEEFRQTIRLYPGSITARRNMAHILSDRLGRTREALPKLEEILALDGSHAAARAGRGVLLARLEKYEDALADGSRALELNRDPTTCYQVACIHALASRSRAEEADRALNLLADVFRDEPRWARVARVDPDLGPLHELERFQNLTSAVEVLLSGGGEPPKNVTADQRAAEPLAGGASRATE